MKCGPCARGRCEDCQTLGLSCECCKNVAEPDDTTDAEQEAWEDDDE